MTKSKLTKVGIGTLEKESLLEVDSEKVEMTLNTDSAVTSGLLIQRLTELYEDPIKAVVRETVSNALDAIEEAGIKDGKVEILSPSRINPVLVIRDNGGGMSYSDLKNIYSKYGASTKANKFNQVGAYGLGAKAPLAYGPEFTVTSIKNGEKVSIIVVREELTNYIKILSREKTNERSGTTVSIPVMIEDVSSYSEEIQKYNKYPSEKDNVSIFIDGVKSKDGEFKLFSEDLVIFEEVGDDGKTNQITSKVWIEDPMSLFLELLSSSYEVDLVKRLRYVVGAWIYESPGLGKTNSNNYNIPSSFFNQKSLIVVELKPGVLSFNSSRDTILNDSSFESLLEKIISYFKSEVFYEKVIREIELSEEREFKYLISSLLVKTNIEDYISKSYHNKLKVNSNFFNKEILISNLNHSSGLNLEDVLDRVVFPEGKFLLATLERKSEYKESSDSFLMDKYSSGKWNFLSVNRLKEKYEDLFSRNKRDKSSEIKNSIVNLFLQLYSNKLESKNALFITNIDYKNNEKNSSNAFKFRKSAIKAIFSGPSQLEINSFSVPVVYTDATKKEIEEVIEDSFIKDSVKVLTVDEVAEEIRKRRKTTTKKGNTNRDKFMLKLSSHTLNKESSGWMVNSANEVTIESIEKAKKSGKKVFFVATKEAIDSLHVTLIKHNIIWLANKNGVDPEEILLVSSEGNHRKTELEIMEQIGDIYEGNESCGNSNYYKDLVAGKKLKKALILNSESNKEKKILRLLLESISGENIFSFMSSFRKRIDNLEKVKDLKEFKDLNLDFDFNLDNFDSLKSVDISNIESLLKPQYSKKYNQEFMRVIEYLEELSGYLSVEAKKFLEAASICFSDRNKYYKMHLIVSENGVIRENSMSNVLESMSGIEYKTLKEKFDNKNSSLFLDAEKEILKISFLKYIDIVRDMSKYEF